MYQTIDDKLNIQLVNVEQRTDEWLDIRKKHITASESVELLISFINKKDHMKRNRADFARYKLGTKERTFSKFQTELMNRGKFNESIAIDKLNKYLDKVNSNRSEENKISFMKELVFTRDSWALASTDAILVNSSSGKIHAPVEIKYTESVNTFNKYREFDHYNYYQLAFQMYVTNTKFGFLMASVNSSEKEDTAILEIDTNSHYYKEIESAIEELKFIHKTICIEQTNPYEQLEDKVKSLAISYKKKKEELENLVEEFMSNEIAHVKHDLAMLKDSLVRFMKDSGTYRCDLDEYGVFLSLCESKRTNKIYISENQIIIPREE